MSEVTVTIYPQTTITGPMNMVCRVVEDHIRARVQENEGVIMTDASPELGTWLTSMRRKYPHRPALQAAE